ncbi:hypothetical protein GCM10027589_19350 [Actinocorallia lasiicapitis]
MLDPMDAHTDRQLVWTTAPGDPSALLDAGADPAVPALELLLARGPVKVTVTGSDPAALAAASVYAWLGVAAFETADPGPLRQVLDMVASIQGVRPPTLTRRALA